MNSEGEMLTDFHNNPEDNSCIERFHRSLKEEEVWTAEYRDVQKARASIARWIQEYNHTGLIAELEIALRTKPS